MFADEKDLNRVAKLLNVLNDSNDKPRQYWTGLRCEDMWCFSDGTNVKNASKLLDVNKQRFHPNGKCAYIESAGQAPSLQIQSCTKRADSICQFHDSRFTSCISKSFESFIYNRVYNKSVDFSHSN